MLPVPLSFPKAATPPPPPSLPRTALRLSCQLHRSKISTTLPPEQLGVFSKAAGWKAAAPRADLPCPCLLGSPVPKVTLVRHASFGMPCGACAPALFMAFTRQHHEAFRHMLRTCRGALGFQAATRKAICAPVQHFMKKALPALVIRGRWHSG